MDVQASTPLPPAISVVVGEVLEVMPGLGLAHVRGAGGTVYGVNRRTPGITFDALRLGQLLRCQVTATFHRVLHAEAVEDAGRRQTGGKWP